MAKKMSNYNWENKVEKNCYAPLKIMESQNWQDAVKNDLTRQKCN